MSPALVALWAMLNLCAEPVTVKITDPVEVRNYVPAEGFRVYDLAPGRVFIGADSVVTICECETK